MTAETPFENKTKIESEVRDIWRMFHQFVISNHKLNPDKIWHSVKLEEGTKDNSNPKFWWFESASASTKYYCFFSKIEYIKDW